MRVLWQGDPRWGKALLGDGTSTIGKAGCVLTSLVEAARRIGGRPDMSIPMLNELATNAGVFSGSELVVAEAAQLVGLDAGPRIDAAPGDQRLRAAIEHALSRPDGGAIVRVDHNGDGKGDHTIFAYGWHEGPPKAIKCTDSAPAKVITLSWPALTATVQWGKVAKHYRVVRVQAIRKTRPTA